jgi:hypothetical protein
MVAAANMVEVAAWGHGAATPTYKRARPYFRPPMRNGI